MQRRGPGAAHAARACGSGRRTMTGQVVVRRRGWAGRSSYGWGSFWGARLGPRMPLSSSCSATSPGEVP